MEEISQRFAGSWVSSTKQAGGLDGLRLWAYCAFAPHEDELRRAAWRVMVSERVEPEQFVFVDEMGANPSVR